MSVTRLSSSHFDSSGICPNPLSVLLTGLSSRSLPELLLVDTVSERLGLTLPLLLAGLGRPIDNLSILLCTGKFDGVCVVDMFLDGWPDPFDLCQFALSSTFLASPDKTSSMISSQLCSSRVAFSRFGDK